MKTKVMNPAFRPLPVEVEPPEGGTTNIRTLNLLYFNILVYD
jgi:hypothetical protein